MGHPVIVYHIRIATIAEYLTRRKAYRQANLEYLMGLRARGLIIGGGPAPDGRGADLFCRVDQPEDIGRLVEGSPFFANGLWTGYTPRSFSHFLEPWELSPPMPDESRTAMVVEGEADDVEMASFALIEARGAGRMAFGGFFPEGHTLALMRGDDPDDPIARLDETGLWKPGTLRSRPLLHVL
jgi:uncharacterized protein YciI